MSEAVRVCTKCGFGFPPTPEFFGRMKSGKAGLRAICNACRKRKHAAQANIINAERRAARAANPEKFKAAAKARYDAKKHVILLQCKAYYKKNKDRIKGRCKAYYEANWHRAKQNRSAYLAANRDAMMEKRRLYGRERYRRLRAEGSGRIACMRFSCMIRRCVREYAVSGKGGLSWSELVGYTANDLIAHIEKQFSGDMSWQRFAAGEIHIDHILPIKSFAMTGTDCPEFRACWALTNLRPLWARDNLSKGAKRTLLL